VLSSTIIVASRPESRQLADPAQRHRGVGVDGADVGAHRLTDLLLPVGVGIGRRAHGLDELLVVGRQQVDEALLFGGEVVVEGALGGAGSADDVGHGGLAVAALRDTRGQSVEQPAAEVRRGSRMRGLLGDRCAHRQSFLDAPCQALVPKGTVAVRLTGTSRYHASREC
jgi:hypothetical protein